MSVPVAGWYQDPETPSQLRWWDGSSWSDHVHEANPAESAPQGPESESRIDAVEELDPLEEIDIDLGELQPDHTSPAVPEVSAPSVARAADDTSPELWRLAAASAVAGLSALLSGLGAALILGYALASGSVSHSISDTLLHAEQGVPITVAVALVVAVVLAAAALYSLRWGLERFAASKVDVDALRRPVLLSVLGSIVVGALAVLVGIPGVVAVLIGLVVFVIVQVLGPQRAL